MDAEREQHEMAPEMSIARKTGRMGRLMHRYYALNARNQGAVGDPLRGQGRVLALLAVKPETTQRELSFLLDMRQQSLSELLQKLEEKGFVTREKSEEDGRVTVVKLTEAGAASAPSPAEMEHQGDALDCLTDEERAQFEELVDKIVASLEEKLVALGDDPYAPPRKPDGHGPERPRGPRDDRGPRDFRGPRDSGPRRDRGPRDDRGPRRDRGPRDDRDRGPRGDFGQRGDRGPRRDNEDRGFRGDSDRRDRRGWNPNNDHLRQA